MSDILSRLLDGRFVAVARLEPNGGHLLEVTGALGTATFTVDQLSRLEQAIAAFRDETAFEDRRSDERTRPHRVVLVRAGR